MSHSGVRNFGCRLTTDATLPGYGIVVLENELLRVTVLADKGSDIYEFLYKPLDIDFMWRSPTACARPGITVPTAGGEAGFFMDYYEGGWQEILPSGGPNTIYRGTARSASTARSRPCPGRCGSSRTRPTGSRCSSPSDDPDALPRREDAGAGARVGRAAHQRTPDE